MTSARTFFRACPQEVKYYFSREGEIARKKKLFSFIPQVELSMVREIKISGKNYKSSEEVAKSEIAKNLLKSDREKFR